MDSLYYPQLIDVLGAAGVRCGTNGVSEGWEHRFAQLGWVQRPAARRGLASPPRSAASVNNDLHYMIVSSPDKPIANMLLDRTGMVWPIAAGAANTQGKGGPTTFSRGTCPLDQGNTYLWAIEAQNNGVGQEWPVAQIDATSSAAPRSTRCSAISSPT